MFYFPTEIQYFTWSDIEFVCSLISEGMWKEKHNLSRCSSKYKTWIREYCKLSTYHSRIKHDIENSTKGRKRNFAQTMKLEKTPYTSPLRASYRASILWRKYAARHLECTVLRDENREPLWHRPCLRHREQGSLTVTTDSGITAITRGLSS